MVMTVTMRGKAVCAAMLVAVALGAAGTSAYKTGEFESCGGGASGLCIDTDAYSCSVSTLSNKCNGGNSIRCCPSLGGFTKKGGDRCSSNHMNGHCKRSSDCTGTSEVHTGLCDGPNGVTCCAPSSSSSNDDDKDKNDSDSGTTGKFFLPNKPDTSGSLGACTTPEDGFKGQCINVNKCTGGTYNGRCPGSSSIICCVPETRKTPVQAKPKMSLATFQSLFQGISATRAAALYPYFLSALADAKIDSCYQIAGFIGQISHESAGLYYFEELASGSAYNGRTDLGNTQPGDGPRFKGRGPIQLTGRANYRSAGRDIGMDFEDRPEQVCLPSAGFKAATWFWNSHGLNRYATASYNDYVTLTRRINGGTNGLTDRVNRWTKAKKLLGCSSSQNFMQDLDTDSNKGEPDFWENNGAYVYAGAGAAGVVAIAVGVVLYRRSPQRNYASHLENEEEQEVAQNAELDQVKLQVEDPASALVVQQM